jgi:hypothetical protein
VAKMVFFYVMCILPRFKNNKWWCIFYSFLVFISFRISSISNV